MRCNITRGVTALVPNETRALTNALRQVRYLLSRNPAFKALPIKQQRVIANNTIKTLRYLAAPEGIPGNHLAQRGRVTSGPKSTVFGRALLQDVDFPEFVSGLIKGVFDAVVDSSIKQMEAYGKLVADVAKSVEQFLDDNVTESRGRDYLVDHFPEIFIRCSDKRRRRCVLFRPDLDRRAAVQILNKLPLEGGVLKNIDLTNDGTTEILLNAARLQIAMKRQQLLARMLLTGFKGIRPFASKRS